MIKIRLSRLTCLLLLLASSLYAAAPASARVDPPPGFYPTPAPAGPPVHPAVVHDTVSASSYALIVGLTVVATLIIVALAARLRRPAVRRGDQPIRALAASGAPVR